MAVNALNQAGELVWLDWDEETDEKLIATYCDWRENATTPEYLLRLRRTVSGLFYIQKRLNWTPTEKNWRTVISEAEARSLMSMDEDLVRARILDIHKGRRA